MSNDVLQANGVDTSLPSNGEELFLSKQELLVAGCKNCVWQSAGQCPHSLVVGESVIGGICQAMIDFLCSLAITGDSSSAVWEKFHIYKARIVEAQDYQEYVRLCNTLLELENLSVKSNLDIERIEDLRMQRSAAKLWWTRLNEHVVKSLGKVVDREIKVKGAIGSSKGIYSANTINFNVTPDKLEDKRA